MMKIYFIQMIKSLLSIVILCLANFAYGQNSVSGKVSSNGEPLPGVNVLVKGTAVGTVSDVDGNYSITVPSTQTVLIFSFIGYESQEVFVGDRTVIDVALVEDVQSLEEVVVIGYGQVQKRDVTGAVNSLRKDDFNSGMQASVGQMIQGRSPGVQIRQTSSAPGGGVSVRIRGAASINASNDPLYVIDGQPINNAAGLFPGSSVSNNPAQRNPLNALNLKDIESIEILKDASATAIYGSRGANGVVIITTKQGKAGKLQVDYNASFGTQQVAKKLDLLTGQEYMTLLNDLAADGGAPGGFIPFTPEEISATGAGTDWQDEIFRTAAVQSHDLSFSGGSENTQYYVSLNYFNQEGVVISSGFKRYSSRINLSHSAGKFKFGLNLTTSLLKDDFVPNGVDINAAAGVIATAVQMDPVMPVYNADGSFAESSTLDLENPVALAETVDDRSETNRTFGNIFAEYNFLPSLSAKVRFASDRGFTRRDAYINTVTKRGQSSNGRAVINSRDRSDWLTEFTVNFSREFNDIHKINAVAGVTYQEFYGRGYLAEASDLVNDNFGSNNLEAGNPEKNVVSSGRFKNQLLSYLGRVNYVFMDKYLLTASLRVDGSSKFGKNNKYGRFPSIALAWRANEEPFMESLNIFSDLKVRASYGVTGNQEIPNYASLVLFGTVGDAVFDDQRYSSIGPTGPGNANLKWETTEQYNIGLDYGFLDNRITGTIDYFRKNTSDLLLNLPLRLSSGWGSQLVNVGDTRNSGFEFLIDSKNLTGEFSWNTTFNLSSIKNEATNLAGLERILAGGARFVGDFTIIKEGEPIFSYFGYETNGIFQNQEEIDASFQPAAVPGDIRFVDVNGDSAITVDDRAILGNPYPDVSMGLSNRFSYKGISLSVFFEANLGYELLNVTRIDTENPIEFLRNRQDYVLNRWTEENPTNAQPSFVTNSANRAVNDRVLEDASFIRLKNIELSYSFPKLKPDAIRSLSLYASVQNLLTITDYSGYDPDVSSFGGSDVRVDYNAYPLAKIYTLGLNIGL